MTGNRGAFLDRCIREHKAATDCSGEWAGVAPNLYGPQFANPFCHAMTNLSPTSAVRRLFDALSAHDVDLAAGMLDRSYRGVDATRSALTVGRDAAKREMRAGLAAFPALTLSIESCVADPPEVFVFWSMDAVHEGAFLGIPPTHQSVTVNGTGLFTVRDGKILRGVHLWDLAGFLRSVKLLPDLPADLGS